MTPKRSLNMTLSCLIALALVFGTLGFGTLGSGTAHALTAPVIKTPKEGDQFTNADVPVEWSPVSWAGFYQVIVVDDATNETAVYAYDIGNVTRYVIPKSALRGNRYYRIIVLAFPPGGGSGAGSGWVRIWNNSAVTQRPVITKPAANEQLSSDQLTFAWNAVPGAVIYHLIITDARTGEQVHFEPNLAGTTVELPSGTLPAGRTYHVKVAAMDSATNGSGMMSEPLPFAVLPDRPVITYPAEGDVVPAENLTITVEPVPNASGYTAILIDGVTGRQLDYQDLAQPEYKPQNLLADHAYKVMVGVRFDEMGRFSPIRAFRTEPGLEAPAITAPANGESVPAGPLLAQWNPGAGAQEYMVTLRDPVTGATLLQRRTVQTLMLIEKEQFQAGRPYTLEVASLAGTRSQSSSVTFAVAQPQQPSLSLSAEQWSAKAGAPLIITYTLPTQGAFRLDLSKGASKVGTLLSDSKAAGTYTYAWNGLLDGKYPADGTYTISITLGTASQSQTVTIDNTAPVITAFTAPQSPATGPTVKFSGKADGAARAELALSGPGGSATHKTDVAADGSFQLTVPVTNGAFTYKATAYDALSNASTPVEGSFTVGVAEAEPELTLSAAEWSPFGGARLVITYKLPVRGNVTLGLYQGQNRVAVLYAGTRNAGTYTATWNGKIGSRYAADGSYEVRLTTASGSAAEPLAVDGTPPTLTLSETPARTTSLTTWRFAGTADGAAALQVSVSGRTPVASIAVPVAADGSFLVELPLGSAADGSYTYTITAADELGNKATAKGTAVLDTTPPRAPVVKVPPYVGSKPVTWSVSAGGAQSVAATVVSGPSGVGRLIPLRPGSNSFVPAGLEDGTYTLSIVAADAAGNTSDEATATFTVDTQAPLVEYLTPTDTVDEKGNATATGSAGTTFTLSFGVVEENLKGVTVKFNGTTAKLTRQADGSYTVVGKLKPAQKGKASTNTFVLTMTDQAGNTQTTTVTVLGLP